jgi:glycosyltransferase involved in cell wall biosynthesis
MVDRIRLLAVHQGGGLGGAPVSLLKLLAGLDPAAFRPSAVFTEPGPVLDLARSLGVPAEVQPTGGALFYSAHARLGPRMLARFLAGFPAAVDQARAVLRRTRPDLLHLNTSVLLAWAAAARHERVPVVWTVREVLGPNPILRRWQAGFILRHARRVVAISSAVQACFPPSVCLRLVPNAVDLAAFSLDHLARRAAIRSELGLDADEGVLMALGSVQRAKGHWLLLDAFCVLLGRRPRSRLVLVCGGVDAAYAHGPRGRMKRRLGLPLDNLEALLREGGRRGVADRVTVTGFVRDVPRVLAAADVVVFPSLEPEGFGRPLIEGMALARPVVATAVGPSAEILGPDAGVVVPPTAWDLAAAVEGLLGDPARRERLGRAGRARVEQRFALPLQVRRMEEIYREAVCA